jgi:hypothetical protein
LWIVSLAAFWRVKPKQARLFLVGMPGIGILSMPLSNVLLENLKWALIPQFQPARAVLYVTAFAVILGAAAGIRAAEQRRWIESIVWFAIVLAVPAAVPIFSISARNLALVCALAAALCCLASVQHLRFAPALLTSFAIVPFFALPFLAHVRNYPPQNRTELENLAAFANARTPKDSVFLFADAGASPDPSIFRAESLRAVYVDWKAGGQINFSEALGMEWWRRWQDTNSLSFNPNEMDRLAHLGIDYLILSSTHALPNRQPEYQNSQYAIYKL